MVGSRSLEGQLSVEQNEGFGQDLRATERPDRQKFGSAVTVNFTISKILVVSNDNSNVFLQSSI